MTDTRVQVHKMNKGPNTLLCLKLGVFKAFYWGDTLIGCSSPEGDYKLAINTYYYNARERKTLNAKMDEANLNAGWVGACSKERLAELVYKGWAQNWALIARERMAGGEA